jgi:hypothetical protein
MKVKCISRLPTEEQAVKLGEHYRHGKQDFHLQIGKEYIVYGISILRGIAWIELASDTGYLYSVPLFLFEITDERVSKYWKVRMDKDGDLMLWPSSFYIKFYHDDLAEGVPEIVEDFNKIQSLIKTEAELPGVE